MAEYNEQCKKCFHFQVCAQVMKNQLIIRNKMLKEENPKCEDFVNAADVVEVVRCKDCKHLMFSDFYGECRRNHLGIVSPDDFCSRGEWKGGAENVE